VLNITGTLTLGGNASLVVSGVSLATVLYNFTGDCASNPGAQTISTHVGDTMNGTFLAPYYIFNLDGTWNGELIGGPLTIGLFSGAKVNQDSFAAVPEPANFSLLGIGVGAVWLFAWRRGKKG
jgi:hypothetical protein